MIKSTCSVISITTRAISSHSKGPWYVSRALDNPQCAVKRLMLCYSSLNIDYTEVNSPMANYQNTVQSWPLMTRSIWMRCSSQAFASGQTILCMHPLNLLRINGTVLSVTSRAVLCNVCMSSTNQSLAALSWCRSLDGFSIFSHIPALSAPRSHSCCLPDSAPLKHNNSMLRINTKERPKMVFHTVEMGNRPCSRY